MSRVDLREKVVDVREVSVVDLGGGEELVLFDYMDGPKVFANLIRRRGDLVVWKAQPPLTSPDAWVGARIENESVVAQSWSGFSVRLSLVDGSEVSREFTK